MRSNRIGKVQKLRPRIAAIDLQSLFIQRPRASSIALLLINISGMPNHVSVRQNVLLLPIDPSSVAIMFASDSKMPFVPGLTSSRHSLSGSKHDQKQPTPVTEQPLA